MDYAWLHSCMEIDRWLNFLKIRFASRVRGLEISIHLPKYVQRLESSKVAKQSSSVIKVGVAYVDIHISRYLQQELTLAADEWLWVISNNYNVM